MGVEKIQDFNMADVCLKDAWLLNAEQKDIEYLKSLNADRLLKGFGEQAGILDKKVRFYGGWENSAIKGHTLGHYMTAIAQAAAATGDSELKERCSHIIEKLGQYQGEDGYLAAIPKSDYKKIEQGNTAGTWVPWYTMHKVLAGIISIAELTGSEKALKIAGRLGDWVYAQTSSWDAETQNRVLAVEYGGMNDCLYELYFLTKEDRHREAAEAFDELPLFQAMYEKKDILDGLHANTTIPKILGALNRYEVVEEDVKRDFYLAVAENFFDIVTGNHTYVTGGNSEWEHFGKGKILDAERTNCNCETCNTYNMLKLSRKLYKITGKKKYSEYSERVFINAILSSQNPKTGMTTYFQPMATGYYKVYSSPDRHFWCCTGTGMENFTKLERGIYYHDDETWYIDQFFSSEVFWEEKKARISMDTALPKEDTVKIRVLFEGEYPGLRIAVRIPDWVREAPVVTGLPETVKCEIFPGQILVQAEENLEFQVRFAFGLRTSGLPDSEQALAITYGPVVLSADLGNQDMVDSVTGVDVTVPTLNDMMVPSVITVDDERDFKEHVDRYFEKEKEGLVFTLKGTEPENLRFTPHYQRYQNRYGLYFYFVGKTNPLRTALEKEEAEKKRIAAATVDSVPVANDQYELSHHMEAEDTSTGSNNGKLYRIANPGGFFSYEMKVDGACENLLSLTFAEEEENREFSVRADGELIKKITLKRQAGHGFYTENLLIPKKLTEGKEKIRISFCAEHGTEAGGIFERVRILRNA